MKKLMIIAQDMPNTTPQDELDRVRRKRGFLLPEDMSALLVGLSGGLDTQVAKSDSAFGHLVRMELITSDGIVTEFGKSVIARNADHGEAQGSEEQFARGHKNGR